MDEFVYIPEFLSVDESETSAAAGARGLCGQDNCCETYCSQYCQNDQSCSQSCSETCSESCSQSCSESCSQTCSETCYGQYCGEAGCCETYCSQYCQSDQTCGESCGESCGEDCGESSTTPTASITVIDVGDDYVQLYVAVDPAYKYYRIFCRQFDNEDDVTADIYGLYRTSDFYYTISNLRADTLYVLNLGVNNTGVAHSTWIYGSDDAPTFQTSESEDFTWTYAGLDENGTPVLGESKLPGYGVYITAAEWNELISHINEKTGSSLSTVSRGAPISTATVRAAANALGVTMTRKYSAALLNNLKNAVNSLG